LLRRRRTLHQCRRQPPSCRSPWHRKKISSKPPLMVALLAVPPHRTYSPPALKIVADTDAPPENTASTPPLLTVVPVTTPPKETISVPPPTRIVVEVAEPPDWTARVAPALMTNPLALP
jgi:hypothetical protein